MDYLFVKLDHPQILVQTWVNLKKCMYVSLLKNCNSNLHVYLNLGDFLPSTIIPHSLSIQDLRVTKSKWYLVGDDDDYKGGSNETLDKVRQGSAKCVNFFIRPPLTFG